MPFSIPTPIAGQDIFGKALSWRDSFNPILTPRTYHPGIDAISRWHAGQAGDPTFRTNLEGPNCSPTPSAAAAIIEQVNDGRVAVRLRSASPEAVGDYLGAFSNGGTSEKPFSYRMVLAAFFRISSINNQRLAIGGGNTFRPGTNTFGDTGVDMLQHAALLSNPGVFGGRWYLSSRTAVAGEQSSVDTGIAVAVGTDTFIEVRYDSDGFYAVIDGIPTAKKTDFISSAAMENWAFGSGMVKTAGGAQKSLDYYGGYMARL